VLAGVGRDEELLRGGKFRGELRAIAAVCLPSVDNCATENRNEDKSCESKVENSWHRSSL
jgi:hypothetical protein